MSELNDLISGLNDLQKNASSKQDKDNGLNFNFSFENEHNATGTVAGLPSFKSASGTGIGLPIPKGPIPQTSAKSNESDAKSDDVNATDTVFGMPVPKFDKDMTANKTGLPSPKINAGLPSPKINNADLPSPKINAGLPSPKINSGLPSPKINAGLPSPKINAGLPSPKINAGLPSPKLNADLPLPKTAVDAPKLHDIVDQPVLEDIPEFSIPNLELDLQDPVEQNAFAEEFNWPEDVENEIPCEPINLFDDPESNTAMPSNPQRMNFEDSALGIVKANDNLQAPLLKLDRQQPTGAFNHKNDIDNDSGLPLMDDPLNLIGNPAPQSDPLGLIANAKPAQSDPLGLIDNSTPQRPISSINQPEENNDILNLFGTANPFAAASTESQTEAQKNTQATTPENPIDAPIPLLTPTLSPAAEEDLQGALNASKADVQTSDNQPKSGVSEYVESSMSGKGEVEEIESEDDSNSELVFELNSIKSEKSASRKHGNADSPKAGTKSSKRNIIIAAIVILLFAVLGFAALFSYFYHETQITDDQLSAIPEQEKIDLDWNLVKYDRQNGYVTFYKKAREKLKDNDISPQERADTQGKILVAVTLAHTRFDRVFSEDELKILDGSIATIAENCNSSWCALGLWSWGMLRGNDGHKIRFEPQIAKEDKTIKNIVELAVDYSNWKPEEEGYTAMKKHGEDILKKVSDSALQWPLTAWIVASTHRRLGQFKEAIQILETMHSDDDTKFPSGAVLLESEIQLAMDNIDNAIKLADTILNHKYADQEDKIRAEQLLFLAKSSTLNDKEFDAALTEYINKNLNNPQNIENAVQTCLYANRSELCKKSISLIQERNPNNIALLDAYTSILLDKLGYVMLVRPDSGCPKVILHTVTELINKGIELDPKNPTIWRHKALVSYALKEYKEADNALLEVERGNSMIWLGAFLRELMQFQSADNDKKSAIRDKLKNYAKDVFLAEDAVSLAIALDYVGDKKTATSLIARAAQLHPEQTPILKSYFDLAIALKDKASADKVAKQLDARHALSYDYEYQYAKLIEETGDPNTALEKMLILIEKAKDAQESTYISYIGELFFKQNQCDSAMPYLTQALEISGGNDAAAHYFKGRCLHIENKFAEALIEFNEAASQNVDNNFYKLWAGLTYIGMNRHTEAQKAFSNIIDDYQIKMDKDSETTLSETDKAILADAHFYRAEVRKFQNRKLETRDDYKEALNFKSDDIKYLKGYAIFLYENEQTKECIEYINKAETIGNGELDPVLYYVRGLSKLRLNDRKEALVELEKALSHGYADLPDPGIIGVRENAEIYERLGYLYRDLGRKDDARNSLRKFLEKTQVLSSSARKDVQADIDKI